MSEIQSKKMVVLYIFDILKKYTDKKNTLTQKEIADILKKQYNVIPERKAVQRYILELKDYLETEGKESGYRIRCSETIRMVPIKDPITKQFILDSDTNERVLVENKINSDFYLERPITDAQLRLLIDSLLFSPNISDIERKKLATKLSGLSNKYYKSHVKHIACVPEKSKNIKSIFDSIEILDDAICAKRKVSFKYMEYGTDKKLHVKKRPDGSEREYIISPYQMAVKEGKYYLICNYDKYDDISNYRIDRITDIKILDDPIKQFESLKWASGRNLDLATYMKEHVYMYSSDNVRVKFRIKSALISDIIDIFGTDVMFTDEDESGVTVTTTTNEMAMVEFAKRHIPDVVILKPQRLRDKVKEALITAVNKYE